MKSPSIGAQLVRALVRVLDVVILMTVVAVLYATAVGIPDAVVRRWLVPAPEQSFALDIQHVRISLFHGLVADDVRVYRRKQIGPALLEARRVKIDLSLYDGIMGRPFLKGVEVEDGIIRPRVLGGKGVAVRRGSESAGWAGTLAVRLKEMEIEGVTIAAFDGLFALDAGAWRIDDATTTVRQGERTIMGQGSVAYDRTGELSGQGRAEGDPYVLIPLLDAAGAGVGSRVIRDFMFPEVPPHGEWSFRVPRERQSGSEVRFQVWLESPIYKGVNALRAEGSVLLSWNDGVFTADIRPLMAVREEGVGRGGLTIRSATNEHILTFDAVSEFDPVAAAQITGVWTNETRTLFGFEGPYKLGGNGRVNLQDLSDVTLQADLSFGRLVLSSNDLRDCAFQFSMRGTTNLIENLQATWYGGKLVGRSEWRRVVDSITNGQYRMAFAVTDADFAKLANSMLRVKKSEYSGRLSGQLSVEGLRGPEHVNTLKGGGNLSIRKGRIFMLPVFGGLSSFLARTIPGLDLVISQSDVQAEFTVDQGRIRSDKILVEGDVLSLLGKGSCGLDGTLDFDVQLTFLKSHTLMSKILRVPTYIFSKLFEFRLTGSNKEPHWYPINFSKDLWQRRPAERNKDGAGVEADTPELNWDEPW
ncbi:MAG: AsmA-like C-terminal region-containing protein [Lentisphaerae bacterium]|nr:AsmA-like C-terminal region-containing protein [Lentisphaerota bacterium]